MKLVMILAKGLRPVVEILWHKVQGNAMVSEHAAILLNVQVDVKLIA